MGEDVRWLSEMLSALMAIILWEHQMTEPTTDFFRNLQAAIARRIQQGDTP
jgi:hypothetical protein